MAILVAVNYQGIKAPLPPRIQSNGLHILRKWGRGPHEASAAGDQPNSHQKPEYSSPRNEQPNPPLLQSQSFYITRRGAECRSLLAPSYDRSRQGCEPAGVLSGLPGRG